MGEQADVEISPSMRTELVGGRYRLTRLIGRGGSGAVFEAHDLKLGGVVAVKLLHESHRRSSEMVERLHREAYLAASLRHPHVCAVTDVGKLEDGSPFLVMERLVGCTLASRLAASGQCSPAVIIPLVIQLLSALAAAHSRGIVHRDLKPDNVFLANAPGLPWCAKLLDFGAASCPPSALPQMESGFEGEVLTGTGLVMGTPNFMAPEQASGQRDLDARTDIYQVGVLLYVALSGASPVAGDNVVQILQAVANGRVVPLRQLMPELDAELLETIERAMAPVREARFQSALDFQEALSAVSVDPSRRADLGVDVATTRRVGGPMSSPADVLTKPLVRR